MDRFCLACWNRRNHLHLTVEQVELSKSVFTCSDCGKMERMVIGMISENAGARSLLRQNKSEGCCKD